MPTRSRYHLAFGAATALVLSFVACNRSPTSPSPSPHPGLFLLRGVISESGVGLENVTVTVISGVGEGLTALTDFTGFYTLDGVAGPVQVRASKDGYLDRIQDIAVTTDAQHNFELTANQPRADYSGTYTLNITAIRCDPGFPETAKRRVYDATVEQTGANLWVSLSGAAFLPGSGGFSGAASASGEISFTIRPGSVWDYDGFDLEERLSDETVLTILGRIVARSTSAGILGVAPGQESGSGGIYHLPPRGASWSLNDATGSCFIDRFEMVRR